MRSVWVSGEMKRVVIVLCVLVVSSLAGKKFRIPLQSPCPEIFQYDQDERGHLYGLLRIECPEDTVVRLQVELSVGNSVEVISGFFSGTWSGFFAAQINADRVSDMGGM